MPDDPGDVEFPFLPRIINPVKVRRVVVLAAEARVREALQILIENIPWLEIEVLSDPLSVNRYRSDQTAVFLFDDTALSLVDAHQIRENNPGAAIVLLSMNNFIHCSPPQPAAERYPYTAKANLVFACDTTSHVPALVITSAVRAAEDLINIRESSRIRRFIFLVVDDEPRWLSQFLPTLYNIIGQRADVMITRTFEETLDFVFGVKEESRIDREGYHLLGHGDDVVFLIADIYLPKGDVFDSDAGRDIIRLISQYHPRIPIVVASKAEAAEDFKNEAFLLPKGDPGSLEKLKDHIRDHSGMGDFLICDPCGREIHRIDNIFGFQDILTAAGEDSREGRELLKIIENYGEKDAFSTWLYMHSYMELGDTLRPVRSRGAELISLLKGHLDEEIGRLQSTPLVINGFKVHSIQDLLKALRTLPPETIQPFSDNDIISSWLDRKGYSDLAEALRPIHESGKRMSNLLVSLIEKWQDVYAWSEPSGDSG